jgi:MFS family permease
MATEQHRDVSAVDVRDEGITVADARRDVGVREARSRFGGVDVPATLVGMLAALALLVILAGLVGAAVGAVGYQVGLKDNADDLSIGALAGGLAAVFVSFVVGGWAAGRMARYDGPRNGLMTGVWAVILGAILAGLGTWLGSEYNVFASVDLPDIFSQDALTAGAVASGIASVIAMLVGGALGGAWGERYHRRADAAIVGTRMGGITQSSSRRASR